MATVAQTIENWDRQYQVVAGSTVTGNLLHGRVAPVGRELSLWLGPTVTEPQTGAVDYRPDERVRSDHGTLKFWADGRFQYTPDPGYVGYDWFTYRVTDGREHSDWGEVMLDVVDPDLFTQIPTGTQDASEHSPSVVLAGFVRARRLDELLETIESQQLRWLWPGRIPRGKLTLLAGEPSAGKSRLALELAARLSRGAGWPGEEVSGLGVCEHAPENDKDSTSSPGSVSPGSVVIATADSLPHAVGPRLLDADADPSRIVRVEPDASRPLTNSGVRLPVDLASLESVLSRMSDAQLVIVDPIIPQYSRRKHQDVDEELEQIFLRLEALAEQYDVAILAVLPLLDGSRGVRQLRQWATGPVDRSVWAVLREESLPERRSLVPIKTNLSEEPPAQTFRLRNNRFEWLPGAPNCTGTALAASHAHPGPNPRQRADAADWLLRYLADQPQPAADINRHGRQAGFSPSTLQRAKVDLGIQTFWQTSKDERCWYWCLAEQSPSALRARTDNSPIDKPEAPVPADPQTDRLQTSAPSTECDNGNRIRSWDSVEGTNGTRPGEPVRQAANSADAGQPDQAADMQSTRHADTVQHAIPAGQVERSEPLEASAQTPARRQSVPEHSPQRQNPRASVLDNPLSEFHLPRDLQPIFPILTPEPLALGRTATKRKPRKRRRKRKC